MVASWSLLVSAAITAAAPPLECGVATSQFAQNTQTLTAAVQTGKLAFWWNWATAPNLDVVGLSAPVVESMQKAFVPMVWGQGPLSSDDFLKDAEGDVMGYNEPDLYGPACCNCDGKQSYFPATSAGWLPLFNPASAAQFWMDTVNNLTSASSAKAQPHSSDPRNGSNTVRRIVSPAMSNGAAPVMGVDCTLDPSVAGHPKRCEGWLALFKIAALQLSCTRFDGSPTNCWDAIDAIQVHAYTKDPTEVLAKLDGYHSQFAEDFSGTNGRSKKSLWLTEVAAGSNDAAVIVPFVKRLMSPSGGLADRERYGFVSHVSWFSEWYFPAFNVSGEAAREWENWSSSLFEPFGSLSDVGDAFFQNCAPVTGVPM